MREITKIMIERYALNKLKYDFMGYRFNDVQELSFHHLIIPRCVCKDLYPHAGFLDWNCALLVRNTSHDYLHTIEKYDYDRFAAISSEMIDENIKGYLDYENLKAIDDILYSFEMEYYNETTEKGKLIVPEEWTMRLLREKKF